MALRRAGKGYVLGVGATSQFNSWGAKPRVVGTAKEIARGLDASAWQRLSAGSGTKGARLHDWAYLELADLDADQFNPTLPGTWTRGLLIRRSLTDGECAYFTTWCPAGTGMGTLVLVEGQRWAIEDSFECAKTEFGLHHNESRSWHGWHRHVSLVMLAFAMMASIRHHANVAVALQTPPGVSRRRQLSSDGPSKKSAASPCAWPKPASSPLTSSLGRSGDEHTKPSRNTHILS